MKLGCLHVEQSYTLANSHVFFCASCCLLHFARDLVLRMRLFLCTMCPAWILTDSGPYFSTSMAKYFSIFQHIWLATAKCCSYFSNLSTYILPPSRGRGRDATRRGGEQDAACAFLAMMLQQRQRRRQLQHEQTQTRLVPWPRPPTRLAAR